MQNINSNFKDYMDKIMNHIYKDKICSLAYKMEISIDHLNSDSFNNIIDYVKDKPIVIDANIEDTVKSFIDASNDSYFIRKAISIEKNYLYPILFDKMGNPKKDYNYTPSLITLWKNDMDELYIEEVYSEFSKESFIKYIEGNFDYLLNEIILYVQNKNDANKIHIPCSNKFEVLDKMKSMILDKTLDFKWAEFLADIDSIRNEMLLYSGDLSIYSEYDKLEDDTEYCLNNHCKYNSENLFNILTTKENFIWKENFGLFLN